MASSYPGALDTFTTRTDQVDIVAASHVNDIQNAIVATQTELGTDVAGSKTNLKARLVQSMAADGDIAFAAATELTIATGAITITQNWHTVDTESDASSDFLATINGGAEGMIVYLRPEHTDRTVIFDHGTGNIECIGGHDIVLDSTSQFVIAIFDAGLSKWIVMNPQNRATRYTQLEPFSFVDETSTSTGDGKSSMHIPPDMDGMRLTYIHGENETAGTDGTHTIQLRNATQAADILSTLLSIDTGETGSDTAATPAVIKSDDVEIVNTNDLLEIDVDTVHSTTAAVGLLITLGFG